MSCGTIGVIRKLYHVHVDHLQRPIMMTDASKVKVWDASFEPFGKPYVLTGTATLNARFPGQWFMLESGLAYKILDNGTLARTFSHDAAGNRLSDTGLLKNLAYTYNQAGRLKTVTEGGNTSLRGRLNLGKTHTVLVDMGH